MKNKKFRILIAAMVAGISAFNLQSLAFAQVTPTTIFVLTNLPTVIGTNTTTNLFPAGTIPTNNVISLRQGQGMAAAWVFTGTNAAATGGFSLNWAVSLDGANYQSVNFLQLTNTAAGASAVTAFTNYASALLNNALYITPYSIQNATVAGNGNITLTSVTVSFGNIVPGGYP
jgi:hypothetical protein